MGFLNALSRRIFHELPKKIVRAIGVFQTDKKTHLGNPRCAAYLSHSFIFAVFIWKPPPYALDLTRYIPITGAKKSVLPR